ncbi:DUF4403 family protein [Winogradskyella schleiferi]|uniref:DUF4403 family protein n=1 Tax=Winogradskyella schleiferi TaxID=2686078 RepID=UPI0015C0A769|nr:DUF4403 family protein [Winogradskyella schleiferi]
MDDSEIPVSNDISITIPVKVNFTAIENYLNEKFAGEIISKVDTKGKEIKYAKIIDIKIAKSNSETYNIEIIIKLQTLTFLYRNRELNITISAELILNVDKQKLFVANYKIDSKGKSWFTDQMLKSIVNTFIYQKIIKKLAFDLKPIVKDNLNSINTKLASNFELKEGISLIGSLENLSISHIKLKDDHLWVLIKIKGWGILNIENF